MFVRVFEGGVLLVLVVVFRIVIVLVMMVGMPFAVAVFFAAFVSMFGVRRAFVDVEFYTLDVLPLCAVVMHVEVAEIEFAQFPFESAGEDAEIDERADHHVAADSGNAVEVKRFHSFCGGWWPAAGRQSATNPGRVMFLS